MFFDDILWFSCWCRSKSILNTLSPSILTIRSLPWCIWIKWSLILSGSSSECPRTWTTTHLRTCSGSLFTSFWFYSTCLSAHPIQSCPWWNWWWPFKFTFYYFCFWCSIILLSLVWFCKFWCKGSSCIKTNLFGKHRRWHESAIL